VNAALLLPLQRFGKLDSRSAQSDPGLAPASPFNISFEIGITNSTTLDCQIFVCVITRPDPVARTLWRDADGEAGRKKPIQQDSLPTRQPLAGSSYTLRRSGAAAGEIMNLIIACAASRSFETVSRPTLFGQGMFTDPGTGPTKSVPGAPTMMLLC